MRTLFFDPLSYLLEEAILHGPAYFRGSIATGGRVGASSRCPLSIDDLTFFTCFVGVGVCLLWRLDTRFDDVEFDGIEVGEVGPFTDAALDAAVD